MSTRIDELTSIDSLASSDLLAVYDSSNSDTRKVSLSTLLTYIQANNPSCSFTTQYSVPVNGETVQVTDGTNNIHLLLNHTSGIAGLIIKLPSSATAVDKQEVLVSSYSAITSLSVNGNGGGLVGEPITLAIGGFFKMKFDATATQWYRVG